jgi:hypothetical protein
MVFLRVRLAVVAKCLRFVERNAFAPERAAHRFEVHEVGCAHAKFYGRSVLGFQSIAHASPSTP